MQDEHDAGTRVGEGGGIERLSTFAEFQREVLDSAGGALVAFTADWCAPCAWLDPYLAEAVEAIESARGGGSGESGLRIFKVDVDLVPDAASRYRIGSVPIVLLFRRGEEVDRSVGVEPERIRGMVRAALDPLTLEPDL